MDVALSHTYIGRMAQIAPSRSNMGCERSLDIRYWEGGLNRP